MRLINTQTGLLEEFVGEYIPNYAILSHTWEDEEVTFKAMSEGSHKGMKGYSKIEMTCKIAAESTDTRLDNKDGKRYVWVDTCCIEKSSSAELSEAINSMYLWYKRATVCYAYLSDLAHDADLHSSLEKCRWLTRGWTLQELIAPREVHFFDQRWQRRGTKLELAEQLARITRIDKEVLQSQNADLSTKSVAHKMSWAAGRKTTRAEDRAYCLLGIFDVNMPLLYGEEGKAFKRLQEEIIKTTADFSIFAWKSPSCTKPPDSELTRRYCSILAETPDAFLGSGRFERKPNPPSPEFAITNSGVKVRMKLLLVPFRSLKGRRGYRYVLPLNCTSSPTKYIGVWLRRCGHDQFIRDDPWSLYEYEYHTIVNAARKRYLWTQLPSFATDGNASLIPQLRCNAMQITTPESMVSVGVWPWNRFDHEDRLFFVTGDSRLDFQDFGIFKLRFTAALVVDGQEMKVEFDCMLYTVEWSATAESGREVQCSLVLYETYKKQIDILDAIFNVWEPETHQVVGKLIDCGIPKSSATAFPIPRTDSWIFAKLQTNLIRDRDICKSDYWEVAISCEVYKTQDLPSIKEEIWTSMHAASGYFERPRGTSIVHA